MWRVGTSGWHYDDWAGGAFYPAGCPRRRWLEQYATVFDTVELNATFYRLPSRTTVAKWADATPDGFTFAVKLSRYLTHVRRLREPAEPIGRLRDRIAPLGGKLGPCLLQLPPNLRADAPLLATVFDMWPDGVRLAFEPRHDSWFGDAILDLCHDHDVALVLSDLGGRPQQPLVATAGWGYVRFHRGRSGPDPGYGPRQLQAWADRLVELWSRESEVFVYFNNDPMARAPRDARRLLALLAA